MKFELPIIDFEKDEIIKKYERNYLPTDMYIRTRELSEVAADLSDKEMLAALCDLYIHVFPGLTEEEFWQHTDPAFVLQVYRDLLTKSTKIVSSKNA